jgi:hypothetical protein
MVATNAGGNTPGVLVSSGFRNKLMKQRVHTQVDFLGIEKATAKVEQQGPENVSSLQ